MRALVTFSLVALLAGCDATFPIVEQDETTAFPDSITYRFHTTGVLDAVTLMDLPEAGPSHWAGVGAGSFSQTVPYFEGLKAAEAGVIDGRHDLTVEIWEDGELVASAFQEGSPSLQDPPPRRVGAAYGAETYEVTISMHGPADWELLIDGQHYDVGPYQPLSGRRVDIRRRVFPAGTTIQYQKGAGVGLLTVAHSYVSRDGRIESIWLDTLTGEEKEYSRTIHLK